METRKNNNPLGEEEKKELELLDNPGEQRMGNTTVGIWGSFQNAGNLLASSNKSKRKERVIELRVKMRAYDLDLDIDKDWKDYDRIKTEEEKRFDERFKDVK